VLEMALLATGCQLSEAQVRTAQRQDGAFELLKQAVTNYRRHLEFTNVVLEVDGGPFRVAIPDIAEFRRLRSGLSYYCHFQLDPAATVNHPDRKWFIKGATLVKTTLDLLRRLRSQVNGMMLPDS